MPSESPNTNVRPTRSPDGSLLGWLQANYPATYAKIHNNPRDRSVAIQYKDSKYAKKHPSRSGRYP